MSKTSDQPELSALADLSPRLRNNNGDEDVTRRRVQLMDGSDESPSAIPDSETAKPYPCGRVAYTAPLHVLDVMGLDVPREFHPERASEFPHTVTIDGVRVHLHQKVIERSNNPFDESGVEWTVVGFDEDTVSIANAGSWDRFDDVTYDEFADRFEPQWLNGERPEPRWGY